MASSLSFPTLSDEDLIRLCTDVVGHDIPVTPAALKKPTMESTMSIFKFFVNEVFGWDVDRALVVPFDQMSRIQYPDMHQEQTPLLRFYGVVHTLLARVHYDSFGIDDITQPRPKRLRRQLSALVNFALHHQNIMDTYGEQVRDAHRSVRHQYERLQKENRDLKSNIHKEIEREEEMKMLVEKEQQLVEEREQEMCALQQRKEELAREARQAMADAGRVQDQIQAVAVQQAKLMEEKQSLEAQVVTSPEKVRQTLVRAREELQALEEQREALSTRQQELQRMRQHVDQLSEGTTKFGQKNAILRDLADRQCDATSKIKKVNSDIEGIRVETSELQSTNRQLNSKYQMIEESRESQMLKSGRYLGAKREELENRTQVLEKGRAQAARDRQTRAERTCQLEQLERRAEHDQQQHHQQLVTLQQQEETICATVEALKEDAARRQRALLQWTRRA
ncbi:trichohyalin-like [Pollicipes pollicipes]|uniref:trichohyalin-like n=1 Tax=Pollicipes pollicipes TaxID=41117 RepID=UPI00188596CF|nr:trichohyalin-like [Pollicipes pollicipes]XP_037090062.1 trichohyalin-like [Pollicipes pollicipes]